MENLLNNLFDDVCELKKLIIDSNEYKNYIKYLEQIKKDESINNEIKDIIILQKNIVNFSSKNKDTKNLEIELKVLNDKLYDNDKYRNYIKSAKKLNLLITNVQKRLNKYFDSLVS